MDPKTEQAINDLIRKIELKLEAAKEDQKPDFSDVSPIVVDVAVALPMLSGEISFWIQKADSDPSAAIKARARAIALRFIKQETKIIRQSGDTTMQLMELLVQAGEERGIYIWDISRRPMILADEEGHQVLNDDNEPMLKWIWFTTLLDPRRVPKRAWNFNDPYQVQAYQDHMMRHALFQDGSTAAESLKETLRLTRQKIEEMRSPNHSDHDANADEET
jgi:hypothetical protein